MCGQRTSTLPWRLPSPSSLGPAGSTVTTYLMLPLGLGGTERVGLAATEGKRCGLTRTGVGS